MKSTHLPDESVRSSHESPELFIGLVGAVGTELDKVTTLLTESLKRFKYSTSSIRLAKILESLPRYKDLPTKFVDEYIDSHMTAGDDFRKYSRRSDAVAILGIGEVMEQRLEAGKKFGDTISHQAYVIRSLKNPEEVRALREVYGSSFYLVAAYSAYHQRKTYLAKRIARTRSKFPFERHFPVTDYLMRRDQEEVEFRHGQQTRDTFHRADFFLDLSDMTQLQPAIDRFTELLFGNTFRTPTRAEYAMFHAQAAALRSAELGRQVGAAISTEEGDIVSVGTNEVPKAGGGLYWEGDEPDRREFKQECDSNEEHKRDLVAETLGFLKDKGWFGPNRSKREISELVAECFDEKNPVLPKDTRIRNVIEYGRAVHAEMAALNEAARRGVSVVGCNMYVTTFPCHLCARQIVTAGIKKVFYIEPYAKSLAAELYPDSILVDGAEKTFHQIPFEPFMGIAPWQYMNLFKMTKRKMETGAVLAFKPESAKLRYYALPRFYLDNEDRLVKNLGERIKHESVFRKKLEWSPDAIRKLADAGNRRSKQKS